MRSTALWYLRSASVARAHSLLFVKRLATLPSPTSAHASDAFRSEANLN